MFRSRNGSFFIILFANTKKFLPEIFGSFQGGRGDGGGGAEVN